MAKKKKKAAKKKATRRRAPPAAANGGGYGRTSKDGSLVAVNIYIHKDLLALLDQDAKQEQRSRRRQLQIQLCKSYGIDPITL